MRVIVGTIAGLGLAVTVAAAQPPARPERAAALGTPVPLPADRVTPVARGVADAFPPSGSGLPSTPLKRPGSSTGVATGPAWLSGADPNLLPAGGVRTTGAGVRQLTPPLASQDEGTTPPKFLDRFRATGEKPPSAPAAQPRRTATSAALPQPDLPTAETPFRGTGANGSPVYAGPPAYRWYGWGSVTPGANPLAPAGQYPKASANWYSITGATPGAFPVPISNGVPAVPGTEPPNYGVARTVPAPPPPGAPVMQHRPEPPPAVRPQPPAQPVFQPTSQPLPRPEVQQLPAESKFLPGTSLGTALPAPVGVPTITAPPGAMPLATPAMPMPQSAGVATKPLAAPPVAPVPSVPLIPQPDSVAVLPPPPPIPALASAEPPKAALPTAEPKPLPTSVTTDPPRDQLRWQPATEPATPPPGTWAPAQGVQPLPTVPVEAPPRVGSTSVRPGVARGQADDPQPDPIATLIKQVCQGRAEGVEVRWTGTKKLQVCFEVRTAPEAQRLVADISKRPELTAYQIDFCVLMK